MIILRNNDSGTFLNELFSDQREFGNRENKAKTRAWRLQDEGNRKINTGHLFYDSKEDIQR